MKRLAWVLALPLTLMACSESQKKSVPDEVQYGHLSLEINGDGLSGSEKALLDQLKSKKQASFRALTDVWVEQHRSAFAEGQAEALALGDVKVRLSAVAKSSRGRLHNLKINMDKALDESTKLPFKYNKSKVSLVHRLVENKSQCYSGTVLYEVINRLKGRRRYLRENRVVIFEDGHVLPGYMVATSQGYLVRGIETTVKGLGFKDYGLAKNLNEAIRIVDAEDFALVEVFKRHLTNAPAAVAAALRKTADKYGIPLDRLEARIGVMARAESTSQLLNASPFGFGDSSSVPDGDQEPVRMDILPKSSLGRTVVASAARSSGAGVEILDRGAARNLGTSRMAGSAARSSLWNLGEVSKDHLQALGLRSPEAYAAPSWHGLILGGIGAGMRDSIRRKEANQEREELESATLSNSFFVSLRADLLLGFSHQAPENVEMAFGHRISTARISGIRVCSILNRRGFDHVESLPNSHEYQFKGYFARIEGGSLILTSVDGTSAGFFCALDESKREITALEIAELLWDLGPQAIIKLELVQIVNNEQRQRPPREARHQVPSSTAI